MFVHDSESGMTKEKQAECMLMSVCVCLCENSTTEIKREHAEWEEKLKIIKTLHSSLKLYY